MAQLTKKDRRIRRATRARAKIREIGTARLTVHRTPRHIYAQVTTPDGARVLVAASTLQEAVASGLKGTGNSAAAAAVGRAIAERAKAAGIESVAFDRSGFRYHGRVKALAEAAREAGLKF
jgi:large subunit ribosomal protein L18